MFPLHDREPYSETQQLNPSVIIEVKKRRQQEDKRHQRNNDVRLRNNYSPDVRSHMPPMTTFVQKRTNSMSVPQRGRSGPRHLPHSEGRHFEA